MTDIVVDLGCANGESWRGLAHRFKPLWVYGFDPSPDLAAGYYEVGETKVALAQKAAWLFDGVIPYIPDGMASTLAPDGEPLLLPAYQQHPGKPFPVECFDFEAWLETIPGSLVVKMDVEGAEYALLERMIEADDAIRRVELILLEGHGRHELHDGLVARLPPVEWWPF